MKIYELFKIREKLKKEKPLIHCITNPISINQCANTILALGGKPIMAEHPGEVKGITKTAGALLLNLGNISDTRIKSIKISAKTACENNIPYVIDLVGIACSDLRKKFALKLLSKYQPAVIKGNYSEINALYNLKYSSLGVDADSLLKEEKIEKVCVFIARKYNCIVLASGKTDIVCDKNKIYKVKNGTPTLSMVTGTGCMLGAICASFISSSKTIDAVLLSSLLLAISGELSETEKGTGSFMVNLIDNISSLTDEDIEKYIKAEEKQIEKD